MSRQPRIQFPGAFYHITSRGNRHADIFLDDFDYLSWQETFSRTSGKFGFVSHSFCQMPNHFHILLETPEANLSDGMHYLNYLYCKYFNHRHERDGHVLQGRYQAMLVAEDAYFTELGRYITLNPVRAGLVRSAAEWRWSSYRYTAGFITPPEWMETELMLAQFSPEEEDSAHAAYREFVAAGMGSTSPLARRRQRLSAQAATAHEAPKPLLDYLLQPNREQAIADAFASGAYTSKAIADCFGINRSTVWRTRKNNS